MSTEDSFLNYILKIAFRYFIVCAMFLSAQQWGSSYQPAHIEQQILNLIIYSNYATYALNFRNNQKLFWLFRNFNTITNDSTKRFRPLDHTDPLAFISYYIVTHSLQLAALHFLLETSRRFEKLLIVNAWGIKHNLNLIITCTNECWVNNYISFFRTVYFLNVF